MVTIEAAKYPYRVRRVLLRWHSGHCGGHNRGCQLYIFHTVGLAQSVVAVTAFQPASAKCHFAETVFAVFDCSHLLLIVAIEIAHAVTVIIEHALNTLHRK